MIISHMSSLNRYVLNTAVALSVANAVVPCELAAVEDTQRTVPFHWTPQSDRLIKKKQRVPISAKVEPVKGKTTMISLLYCIPA
jgi:hypothetical protein